MTENPENFSNFEVTDRKSFVEFLHLLNKNFAEEEWENNNLQDFLQAMESYANDIQGYYDNTNQKINADQPTWKTFADILRGSTMYE